MGSQLPPIDNGEAKNAQEYCQFLLIDAEGQISGGSDHLLQRLNLSPLPQPLAQANARLLLGPEQREINHNDLPQLERQQHYPVTLLNPHWRCEGQLSPLSGSSALHWHLCLHSPTPKYNLLEQLMGMVPGMLFQFEMDAAGQFHIPYVNEGSLELVGVTPQQAMEDADLMLSMVHPEDREGFYQSIHRSARQMTPWQYEFRAIKDGQIKWLMGHSEPQHTTTGSILWHGIIVDIQRQKELELYLAQSRNRLYQAQRLARLGHWEADLSTGEMYWSSMTYHFLGLDKDKVQPSVGLFLKSIHPDDLHKIRLGRDNAVQAGQQDLECRFIRPDGTQVWGHVLISHANEPQQEHIFYGSVRDITEQKRMELALKQQSITDPLTQTYNRRYFEHQLEKELARYLRNGKTFSLLMLDIDHFKVINDSYGHSTGDEVLKQVAASIDQRLRQSDILARIGGEEFAVLLPETSLDSAQQLAEQLRQLIANLALNSEALSFQISATFGVAQLSSDDKGYGDLMKRADKALYKGKESGRNRVCISGPESN